ncbi:hypothetical protein [Candidatus Enterococcus ikei]|uniref:Uncharacterized protein n=1 Tax=Candidatus Enterococcus ikei TaxID=2815326 RepID=A0ABS3GZ30_9ENTE|nr:hypothetical protein [Enterococcus sp. DIV0869a]MBO0440523.1 hypothetical protein [Enterococcus sp. DIV0869a]
MKNIIRGGYRKVPVISNGLEIRKRSLEDFLLIHGTVEVGKNLFIVPYNELREELFWLQKFEKEVCSLQLITDPTIYYEWLNKKREPLLRKLWKLIAEGKKKRGKVNEENKSIST